MKYLNSHSIFGFLLFVFIGYNINDIKSNTINHASGQQEDSITWDLEIEGYVKAYYDEGRNAYAINTVKQPTDKWAAATTALNLMGGIYDIEFTSLLESDGECSYRLYIDDKEVLSFKNPKIFETEIEEYAPHTEVVKNVKIKNAATIRVEFLSNSNGLVPEGDAFGYARARWRDVKFTPSH